ncbi:MAG TPA: hypothetical protein VIJ61_05595 [Thermoanaerobaculia bacterium]
MTRIPILSLALLWLPLSSPAELAAGAQAQPPEISGTSGPPARKERKPVRPLPSEAIGVELRTVPEIRLPAIDREELLGEDAANPGRGGRGKALRDGVVRDVRMSARDGAWHDLAGRHLWVGEIVATGALGLRLHCKGRLPAGSELAVYAPAAKETRELHESFPAGQNEFWTGTIAGERARIEYLSPPHPASRELPFTVDRLLHRYRAPVGPPGM